MAFLWISFKKLVLKILYPFYFQIQKRAPSKINGWIDSAGPLDFSSMLTRFNWFHRLFFRNALKRILIEPADIQKIKAAASKGPILYMMRNWGQIEYNFFNLLFIKEKLPLAKHANLTWMGWWMPAKMFLKKILARAHFFYTHKKLPEEIRNDSIEFHLCKNEVVFTFLNLPSFLGQEIPPSKDVVLSILKAFHTHHTGPLQIIPLNLIYDRRPEKAQKTMIDLLFGERENPGRIRKTVLFLKNFKKRAMARIGDPIDLQSFLETVPHSSVEDQSTDLRNHLHQIFFKEKHSITGPPLKTRERMIDRILSNETLREELISFASKLKKPTDELYLQAEVILEEIVSDPNYHLIDFWEVTLRSVFNHLYEGLVIDPAEFQKVKEVARQHPLILIPTHRSHLDYLLLSYIFYRENLSMPMVAAGKNLSFWPMGYIFRKSGAYFIRRSFGKDKLYTSLFKAYIRTLMHEGYFQEFFIEGTRSRTGKILPPRTGLLSFFLDCFQEGSTEDLHFVPIAINYEKVLEEKAYAKEARGNSKTNESFWDLFKIRKHFQRKSGKIYVNFAEPISLKKYLEKQSVQSTLIEENRTEKRQFIDHLADHIIHSIQETNFITASAIVATALLADSQKSVSFSSIVEKVKILKSILQFKKAKLADFSQDHWESEIRTDLERYQSRGILKKEKKNRKAIAITKQNDSSIKLSSPNVFIPRDPFGLGDPPIQQLVEGDSRSTTCGNDNSVQKPITLFCEGHSYSIEYDFRIYLSYYKNNLIYHLIGMCLIAHLLLKENKSFEQAELEKNYLLLKKIFRHESTEISSFEKSLKDLIDLKIIEENSLQILQPSALHLLVSLIKDSVHGYRFLLEEMSKKPFTKMTESTLLEYLSKQGKAVVMKKETSTPEAFSKFIFQDGLKFLQDEKLILVEEVGSAKQKKKIYSTQKNFADEIKIFLSLL